LLGERRARTGPTESAPFGRGRERYFWAFVVGLVLFGLGGVVSIIEGARRLTAASHSVDHPRVAVALIMVGVVFESWSLRVGIQTARNTLPPGKSLWGRLRESRNPDVTVVVFEDATALVGLALALIGVTASAATGDGSYDAAATIAIGALLCCVAAQLSIQMHALLVGRPAGTADLDALDAAISGAQGVNRILNLRTEHIGPDDLLVCVKIELKPPVDFDAAVDTINEIERRVHQAVPATLTCYIEPDRFDPARASVAWT
jgi:cation diffusion facilitator family transporter